MRRLSDGDHKILLNLSRQTLEFLLDLKKENPFVTFRQKYPATGKDQRGCFVTLYGLKEELRGCIGTVATDNPLWKNVSEFTEKAAFHDPRFESIHAIELPEISIQITVLGKLESLPNKQALIIGKHGLCVTFGTKRGVLLPEAPLKQGWNAEEFMKQACLKAGLLATNLPDYTFEYFEGYSFGEK